MIILLIKDWYKAEFMDGQMNVYLENSFIGKSTVNTQEYDDTLEVSFGIDNNISVKHEKILGSSENQWVGTNRKETLTYKITVRNNKTYAISAKISDQLPVSTTKEIQVEALELSGGTRDENSGRIEWKIDLKPNETKDLLLKYTVKYPRDKRVITE